MAADVARFDALFILPHPNADSRPTHPPTVNTRLFLLHFNSSSMLIDNLFGVVIVSRNSKITVERFIITRILFKTVIIKDISDDIRTSVSSECKQSNYFVKKNNNKKENDFDIINFIQKA
jgi:hypothetical protein